MKFVFVSWHLPVVDILMSKRMYYKVNVTVCGYGYVIYKMIMVHMVYIQADFQELQMLIDYKHR